MKEKATYCVLAMFRHSEGTLKGQGITPLKPGIYRWPKYAAPPSLEAYHWKKTKKKQSLLGEKGRFQVKSLQTVFGRWLLSVCTLISSRACINHAPAKTRETIKKLWQKMALCWAHPSGIQAQEGGISTHGMSWWRMGCGGLEFRTSDASGEKETCRTPSMPRAGRMLWGYSRCSRLHQEVPGSRCGCPHTTASHPPLACPRWRGALSCLPGAHEVIRGRLAWHGTAALLLAF